MSKKKQLSKRNISKPSLFSRVQDFTDDKKPVLLFVGGFATLMVVFYAFWFSEIFKDAILSPVVTFNALLAGKVLNVFGFQTQTNGSDIFSSAFSISVKQGCDAIEPIAIFTFAVLLFPVGFRNKLLGLVAGIPLLWLLNQLRIVSLFVFGLYSPVLFDIMHVQVWQAVFIVITLILLTYWIVWAMKRDKNALI